MEQGLSKGSYQDKYEDNMQVRGTGKRSGKYHE